MSGVNIGIRSMDIGQQSEKETRSSFLKVKCPKIPTHTPHLYLSNKQCCQGRLLIKKGKGPRTKCQRISDMRGKGVAREEIELELLDTEGGLSACRAVKGRGERARK